MNENFKVLSKKLVEIIDNKRDWFLKSTRKEMQWDKIATIVGLPKEYFIFHELIGWIQLENTLNEFIDLIPWHRVLPIEEAIELYKSKFWSDYKTQDYFPFMADFFWDYVAVKIKTQELVQLCHDDMDIYIRYDNFWTLIKTLIEEYETNFFIDEASHLINCDMKKSFEIGRKNNPKSNFFRN